MKELSPPPLNLRRLYSETMEWEPVMMIISPGADPSQELAELAAETVGRDQYHEVEHESHCSSVVNTEQVKGRKILVLVDFTHSSHNISLHTAE